MQTRNGRSCGKVPVRLISGSCATIALNPLQRVVASALFSLSSMGGRESGSDDLLSSFLFFFYLLPYFPPHRAYALCRYLLPLLRVVFVRETAVIFFVLFCPCNSSLSSCCFVRATGICFPFSTYYGVLLAAFPFRPSCITCFRIPVVRLLCFLLFFFFFFFFFFPYLFLFIFLFFYGLACSVVFSYPVR